jgi:hypothetical protein
MTPLARRILVATILAAVLAVVWYVRAARALPVPFSGRTFDGILLGILGTLAMLGAWAYSWRRRFIARASRPIEVTPERRKDLLAREKRAFEQLQAVSRRLMRNPNEPARAVQREADAILKENGVRRTIRARVVAGKGSATRLVLERREWGGRLQTWYYWHLALGCLAVLLILLHAGFRFGNVVATLAFVFLVAVVATGIAGVLIYWIVPPALTVIEERAERTPEELREEFGQVVGELESLAAGKSEAFRRVYDQEIAIPGVSMRPSLRWLLGQAELERDTARPDRLRLVVMEIPPSEQEDFRKAMRLIFRKEKIEVSLYPQLRYDYMMKVWLTAHIPLSAGLAAFSVIHIVSVLYY